MLNMQNLDRLACLTGSLAKYVICFFRVALSRTRPLICCTTATQSMNRRSTSYEALYTYTRGYVLTFAPDHISLHAAYYLMRKIALAYLHPEAQLQDALCKTLRSYSKEDVSRIDMFCLFLTDGNADLPERQTHDIDKPLSEWTQEDEWGYVTGEPWNYVDRVIQAVRNEERRGRDWLEKVLGTHVNMVRPSNT